MGDRDVESDPLCRAARGDQSALEHLLLDHYDRLAARVRRRIPASMRSSIDEDDIIQQVFVDAFVSMETFQPKGPRAFYRWLIVIADHRLSDAIKAHSAAKRGGDRIRIEAVDISRDGRPVNPVEIAPGLGRTPSQSIAGREAVGAMRGALGVLKQDYRRVLYLRYIQGWSVSEVARAMNRTPHAIHNLCHRALKELRIVMGSSSQYFSRF